MKRFLTLLKIEGKLSLRCIDSVFFGIGMPVGIMLLIGIISGNKPAFRGAGYTLFESSFGALITVGICATAFMGIPITIADYRDKKILKHFFVTPVRPSVLLLVHGVINMLISLVSSLLVYLTVKVFFGFHLRGSVPGFIASYFLVMASMYSLGMVIASISKNIKIANVVCSLVYFPMLFLSGATVPYEIFPKALRRAADILPLTQGIKLLKGYSLGLPQTELYLPVAVMVICIIVGTVLSVRLFRWE